MAVETKKYLDLVGLTHYDEKIKAYIKTNGSDVTDKLVALIGAAEKGEDEATILARIADLESAVGDVSELDAEVANLVKAILGEKARAEGAEGDLADLIGEIPEDAEAETVVGYAEELVAAEEAARKAQIGELGKVSEEEGAADHTVKSYVDAAVEAINGDAEALEERVEALEATHATKEDGSFKTVAEEVNEAVTDLIDGAPDALDTLKEIADWIANQDESGVTDAATLVARVEENAQAIADETERAEGAESDLQDAIDAVEEKVDAFARIEESEIDALFGETADENA